MFEQAKTENKQRKIEDVFVSMNGKRYRRADVENPSRPGYLRDELVPIPPDVWSAGVHFDLFTPTGRRMRPLPLTPDPSRITVAEAPVTLRQIAEAARAALETHRAKMGPVLDAIYKAEVAQKQAAGRQDRRAYNAAMAAEQGAREQYKTLCDEDLPLAARVSDAQEKLKMWLWDEGLYRTGVPRPEPLPTF